MPSPYYKRNFQPGGFYHIYNRGANKLEIFKQKSDYHSFLDTIDYYYFNPAGKPKSLAIGSELKFRTSILASSFNILAYCLMPNHFHFLFHQKYEPIKQNSIINFMHRLSISHAMYINKKYQRSGALFQGRYKNITITTDNRLYTLIYYIHHNPQKILKLGQKLADYPYSSYADYLGRRQTHWLKVRNLSSEP